MSNRFDVIIREASHNGLHDGRLNRLARSVCECCELAFHVQNVLTSQTGPDVAALSDGSVADNTRRNTLQKQKGTGRIK